MSCYDLTFQKSLTKRNKADWNHPTFGQSKNAVIKPSVVLLTYLFFVDIPLPLYFYSILRPSVSPTMFSLWILSLCFLLHTSMRHMMKFPRSKKKHLLPTGKIKLSFSAEMYLNICSPFLPPSKRFHTWLLLCEANEIWLHYEAIQ